MKVCEKCGNEIATKDGDNTCSKCENRKTKSKAASKARRERDEVMRSMGMTKVRGAMGGVYWE